MRSRRKVTELRWWPGSEEEAGRGWRAVGTGPDKEGQQRSHCASFILRVLSGRTAWSDEETKVQIRTDFCQ